MNRIFGTITQDRLKHLLDYDADAGVFRWKNPTSNRVSAGSIAGSDKGNGYWQISLDGKIYFAHRLAWLYVHGAFPELLIDHINGDRSDNRICNLRVLSHADNIRNVKRAYRSSKTGLLGVSSNGPLYCARIVTDGVKRFLGNFKTPEEAHEAYMTAKRALHKSCTI